MQRKIRSVPEFQEYYNKLKSRKQSPILITICGGTGCSAWGSEDVRTAFDKELKKQKVTTAEVKVTGCHGFCERGPVTVIYPNEIFYQNITPKDVPEIVNKTIKQNKIITRLTYRSGAENFVVKQSEVPFYKLQTRHVLEMNGKIDPTSVKDYISSGGYQALCKVLSKYTPEQVIGEIKNSQLRGRGGAGFPTGMKWELCRKANLKFKVQNSKFNRNLDGDNYTDNFNVISQSPNLPSAYIICNADEGDPGAFMDRSVLEGNPHSVIEGMIIGGYAIGTNAGYVYVRAEYPIAVRNLKLAIHQCEQLGFLDDNILSSGFGFKLYIKEGAGAFVCGEETALIASIEGKRGMPRPRPPFPAESGLFGKPTNINNVETWANVPIIINNSAEWYKKLGTEKSKGTKIFSLTGKINNTGLVEVPIGTQLAKIVFSIGNGVPLGRQFKAVQTGGPSGGCIPMRHLTTPVDYETLSSIGSIMGSGGMIVVDETTCMVELARYFLSFTQSESCGKCTPCRVGTKRMLEILTAITEGRGRPEDINTLLELADTVKSTALCGLGQTTPNPVLSTLKYFRDEYESHINQKHCPAGQCKSLVTAPCNNTCPGGINVAQYIQNIRIGEFEKAYEIIKESIPLPLVCGRVCYHPCEIRCRRGELDKPVAINNLKRFVSDYVTTKSKIGKQKLNIKNQNVEGSTKKVAIIGSGPAGLTCAYELAKQGHLVTIFESRKKLGGTLQYGIPSYRLPKKLLDYEIKQILKLGIKTVLNKTLGKNYTIKQLRDKFDAIFIAIGANVSQKLDIPGEQLSGIIYGIEFLENTNSGKKVEIGKNVIVIGGGNVALDSARGAIRSTTAESVTIVYRRARDQMPAHKWEIEEAVKEGVKLRFLLSPVEILGRTVTESIRFSRMKLSDEYDSTCRRKTVELDNQYEDIQADTVIVAVGQKTELSNLLNCDIITNSKTMSTNIDGIFTGGDCVTGPGMVIQAIAAGKRAAKSIIQYLNGKPIMPETYQKIMLSAADYKLKTEAKNVPRCKNKTISMVKRKKTFNEVEKTMNKKQAMDEASRCLQCHLEK